MVKQGGPDQEEIVRAIFEEAARQNLNQTTFAELAGKDHNTIFMLRKYSNIGIHLLLDLTKALDIEIEFVNREGDTILCL